MFRGGLFPSGGLTRPGAFVRWGGLLSRGGLFPAEGAFPAEKNVKKHILRRLLPLPAGRKAPPQKPPPKKIL